MAKSPDISSAAERLIASGLRLPWPPGPGPVTDYIDMDQLFVRDPDLGREFTALQFEARAQIHSNLADLAGKAAELLRRRG